VVAVVVQEVVPQDLPHKPLVEELVDQAAVAVVEVHNQILLAALEILLPLLLLKDKMGVQENLQVITKAVVAVEQVEQEQQVIVRQIKVDQVVLVQQQKLMQVQSLEQVVGAVETKDQVQVVVQLVVEMVAYQEQMQLQEPVTLVVVEVVLVLDLHKLQEMVVQV
tara:strand:+ start:194 stop:688 length:495 start_codon:yes stop_codon:yes gene_type:complete